MKKIFKLKGFETIFRMVGPKIVTMIANVLVMGPHIILRSTMELLRANIFTRVLSCLTLLVLDIKDLARRRISKMQFIRNIILSALLILSGTLGWNLGSYWIAVEIVGGMVGAGILGFAATIIMDKLLNRFIKSDAVCMREIVDRHLTDLPEEDRKKIRKKISDADLKKMYASEDKDAFAVDMINEIKAGFEADKDKQQ